eukprot:CAMPEP_0177672678 /NCGR_PEP_ID=MMETSP0447-20121125/25486_1 /TAXON_ID=0 /ORGANISM="Stygamoeba regulata, Strain BSH-02190019" /LENGTH=45 /DNA_ID= /DNA_START= /DNA_END= /DNA_ORIENTATION=
MNRASHALGAGRCQCDAACMRAGGLRMVLKDYAEDWPAVCRQSHE